MASAGRDVGYGPEVAAVYFLANRRKKPRSSGLSRMSAMRSVSISFFEQRLPHSG